MSVLKTVFRTELLLLFRNKFIAASFDYKFIGLGIHRDFLRNSRCSF